MIMSLGIIFICGLLLAGIFKRLGLPSLVGMLIAGIVLGPYALNLIDASILAISDDLRKIALIIILFRAGLGIDISVLKKIGKNVLFLSFVPAILESAIISVLSMWLFDFDFPNALLLGVVISAVSPAVIVPYMLSLKSQNRGSYKSIPELVIASASLEDVLVIVLFFSVLGFVTTNSISFMPFASLVVSLVLGVLCGVISAFVCNLLFKTFKIKTSAKAILLLSLCFLFVTLETKLTGVVKFSGLIASMVLGISLNSLNMDVSKKVSKKFKDMWVANEIILFVLVGAKIDVSYALNGIWVASLIIVVGLIFRFIGIYASLFSSKLNKYEKLFVMISFIPKATVQAAIGPIALSVGLSSGKTILTVAVIAILITAPLGAFLMMKLENILLKEDVYV